MLQGENLLAYVNARRKQIAPLKALELARTKPVCAGYPQFYTPEGGITRQPKKPTYAWIENPADAGLRLVDYADKIANLRHNGWYTMDDGNNGEVMRGVVFRLAHGRGFIAGYADPCNDGPAFVELSIIDDEKDAARAADNIAESYAERERDYQRAWQAGRQFDDLLEEIQSARRDCLELIRETKKACAALANYSAIKATIRGEIKSYLLTIKDARAKRATLEDEFGAYVGFKE